VHYSGAPLAVDFGEQDNTSVVCLVEAAPGIPARVTDVPVTSGRRLRTVHGTLAELEAKAGGFGDDYLRVYLREAQRAGLREDTVAILPNALEVRIDPEFAPQASQKPGPAEPRTARTPEQLFTEYCDSKGVSDPKVAALFRELHDEVTAADGAELSPAG
jgi:exonuclease SbcD